MEECSSSSIDIAAGPAPAAIDPSFGWPIYGANESIYGSHVDDAVAMVIMT